MSYAARKLVFSVPIGVFYVEWRRVAEAGRAHFQSMRILKVVAALAVMLPAGLEAQSKTYWRVPSSLGGAMIGTGVGWAADVVRWYASECGICGPTLIMTPIGLITGGVIGFVGGLSADQGLAAGDSLSAARRGWLRFATFLTPPALGSFGAFLLINPPDEPKCVSNGAGGCSFYRERDKLMSDEKALALGVGGGLILGYVLQEKTKGALHPRITAGTGSLELSFSYPW
jgi:hypothetical protein